MNVSVGFVCVNAKHIGILSKDNKIQNHRILWSRINGKYIAGLLDVCYYTILLEHKGARRTIQEFPFLGKFFFSPFRFVYN
jgi:hypothetical protein